MATPTSITPWTTTTLTGDAVVNALLVGTQWAVSTLSYSFAGSTSYWSTSSTTGYGPQSETGEPWSADYAWLSASDAAAVRAVLGRWAAVADIRFTETTDSQTNAGDLRFGYSYSDDFADSQAWAYFPGQSSYAGDVWFNRRGTSYTRDWVEGSHEHMTVTHEIGHALGLKHPFESEPGSPSTLPAELDSRSFTVMSYSAYAGDTNTYFTYEPTTPMVLDIVAIQHLYGANTSTGVGNTTYTFTGTSLYHRTIWDAGGTDTIVYNASVGGEIDLTAGVGGGSMLGAPVNVIDSSGQVLHRAYNIYIANDTVIENATGGSGNDKIIGNSAANSLNGGAGNDTLTGGSGNDTLNGSTGSDRLVGGAGSDTYHVNATSDVVSEAGTTGTDAVMSSVTWTLGANLERLTLTGSAAINGTGNTLANVLTGNAGANSLSGGAGNDTLNGAAGVDRLTGGTGNDTYYVDVASDVISETSTLGTEIDSVRSAVSWTLGASLERLTLTGSAAINATGNTLANTLTGNAAANNLNGRSGNDILGGGAGNDILNGSTGTDTMTGGTGNDTYYVDAAADVVSETSTTVTEIDTVQSTVSWTLGANLERLTLTGSAAINATGNTLANVLNGNAAANRLNGGTGNDTLGGGSGNDVLDGSSGKDSLTGGAGNDIFRFTSAPSSTHSDRVLDFSSVFDTLQLDDADFAGIGALGSLSSGAFRTGTAAADVTDRVIYNSSSGALYYDADGSGAGAALLFATLAPNTSVGVSDFVII